MHGVWWVMGMGCGVPRKGGSGGSGGSALERGKISFLVTPNSPSFDLALNLYNLSN